MYGCEIEPARPISHTMERCRLVLPKEQLPSWDEATQGGGQVAGIGVKDEMNWVPIKEAQNVLYGSSEFMGSPSTWGE